VAFLLGLPVRGDPIERAERFFGHALAIVHRADPKCAVGSDLAVVQSRRGVVLLDLDQAHVAAVLGIVEADLLAESNDDLARTGEAERTDLTREGAALRIPGIGIEAMN